MSKDNASVTIACNHCDWSVTSDAATAVAASNAHNLPRRCWGFPVSGGDRNQADQTWTTAELDTMHAAVGLGEEWQASERRAEMIAANRGEASS